MNPMRYRISFFACAALAILTIIIWLASIMPAGEGSYGMAKLVLPALIFGSGFVFCLIWFPVNLGIFLWFRRHQLKSGQDPHTRPEVITVSGFVFVVCILVVASLWVAARSRAQLPPPAPEPPTELKDVKTFVDQFIAQERSGTKRGPNDGTVSAVAQLVSLSKPEVGEYIADHLDDSSDFLQNIAFYPNCAPRLVARFLTIPSTHVALAMNRTASAELLEILSQSTNRDVRFRVAMNRNSSKEALEHLVNDSDREVGKEAKQSLLARTGTQ